MMIRDYLPLSYLPFSEAFLPQITQIVSSGGYADPPLQRELGWRIVGADQCIRPYEVHFSTPPLPLPSTRGGE